jgi:hypothetical protein
MNTLSGAGAQRMAKRINIVTLRVNTNITVRTLRTCDTVNIE